VQERGNVAALSTARIGGKPSWSSVEMEPSAHVGVEERQMHTPSPLRSASLHQARGRRRKSTDLNEAPRAGKQIPSRAFSPSSARQQFEIQAFLTKPLGLKPDAKYPLIVNITAAPRQQGKAFNFKNQVYAARLGHADGELSRLHGLRAHFADASWRIRTQ